MQYKVKWEIDVYADSSLNAARIALKIQKDPTSTALVFNVNGEEIDLTNRFRVKKKSKYRQLDLEKDIDILRIDKKENE